VYVRRRVLSTSFGDARRGFFFSRVRDNLFSLAELEPHPKNWRPTTLVLTGNPRTRETLARYAIWMESGRGLVTLAEVLVGDFHEQAEERHEALERLDNYIEERNLNAFGEVMVAENFDSGMASLIQGHSIGPLKPNMVMVGWSSDRSRAVPMVQHLRLAAELDMSQVILVDRGLPDTDAKMRIDVWWRGDQNGSLMMILAYLLTLNLEWSQVTLRILRLIADESERDEARGEILELIEAARVEADIRVVLGDSITEVVHAESHDASVVILGFNIVPDSEAQAFHDRYTELCEGLPTTLLVCSSGDADLMA
jgi:hypothetical protein